MFETASWADRRQVLLVLSIATVRKDSEVLDV